MLNSGQSDITQVGIERQELSWIERYTILGKSFNNQLQGFILHEFSFIVILLQSFSSIKILPVFVITRGFSSTKSFGNFSILHKNYFANSLDSTILIIIYKQPKLYSTQWENNLGNNGVSHSNLPFTKGTSKLLEIL